MNLAYFHRLFYSYMNARFLRVIMWVNLPFIRSSFEGRLVQAYWHLLLLCVCYILCIVSFDF